ncbi:MAG: 6-hydroxymethylpterin diphosphokinase MptE-like protein [Arcobacteraceae bacterium]
MTEAQIQLQNALTTTFLANLAFLSEYDNELYHRVDELSRMIENETYKEKYALDFIMENGEFDIYDIVNNKYLYDKKPKKFNDELINKIQFDEKQSILNVEQYFTFKEQYQVNKDERFNFVNLREYNILTLNDTFGYTSILNDFMNKDSKKLKRIDKFIFLGTLLGRHIPKIAEKINAKTYLILERNLEIFRLSLFVVDYKILAKKGAIFSIMDTPRDEERKIFDFLKYNRLENYIIKLSTTNINIDKYVDNVLNVLNTLNPVGYDYNRYLYTHVNRTTQYIKEKYRILLFDKIKEKCNIFYKTPILYIASGPSLDENINWIKENQDKFFIVTIGSSYKKLLLNGIRIDMITTLDEQYVILNDKQFDEESVSKISENTIVLASTITNRRILEKFNQKNLFLYEVFFPFHIGNLAFDGYSIGEVTLDILLKMNPSEIYLLGLDLALNQKTGDTHSKNSDSGIFKLNLQEKQNKNIFDHRNSLIKVKGNLKKEVYTTPLFFTSIKSTEAKILFKNKKTKIYNLSAHGAYFFSSISKRIKNVRLDKYENKSSINNELKKILIENSLMNLSINSKKSINKEILFMKRFKEHLERFYQVEFKNYNLFLKRVFMEIKKIQDKGFLIFNQIISNYLDIVVPYLLYHFNDKNLINESEEVKNVKKIFIKQIKDITNDYILCLERLTK